MKLPALHGAQYVRARYQWALAALPMLGMFAAFAPVLYLAWLLEGAINHQPGGKWLLLLVFAALVVCLLLGYAMGWLMNVLIARFLLGWSRVQLRAVFLHDEPPEHWLLDAQARARLCAEQERLRQGGVLRFVLVRGLLGWGLTLFVVVHLLPKLIAGKALTPTILLSGLIVWGLCGLAFGLMTWRSAVVMTEKS